GNTVVQHVRQSPAIHVSNADTLVIANNAIEFSHAIAPIGTVLSNPRAVGIEVPFGVVTITNNSGYYLNERTEFKDWAITGNDLREFVDGLKITPKKAKNQVSPVDITRNVFHTMLPQPRGIYLEGDSSTPQSGFIADLVVDDNYFGCGFPAPLGKLPSYAYV